MTFSGLVNRHHGDVISYLDEENCILKEQLYGRAFRLKDDQRLALRKQSFRDVFVPQAVPAPFVLVG